jgi:protein-tyrosine phosphatase
MIKTSQTDPLYIKSVSYPGSTGLIGMTLCPGKQQSFGMSGTWQRDLSSDLAVIRGWGAMRVVTLLEGHELDILGVRDLPLLVTEMGMRWHHLPIRDRDIPDQTFETTWMHLGQELTQSLKQGERILLHCMGGLGRTGTIAARFLIEAGMTADEAITAVRAARRGAIETREQEHYLHRLTAGQG